MRLAEIIEGYLAFVPFCGDFGPFRDGVRLACSRPSTSLASPRLARGVGPFSMKGGRRTDGGCAASIASAWQRDFFDLRSMLLVLAVLGLSIMSGCSSTITYGEMRRRELFHAMLLA
jgi:hypothetical protein